MSERKIYRVTPSLLNNWSCPQKGAYTDILQIGLADTTGSSSAMDIGTLFHAMAEVYYQLEQWTDFSREVRRVEAIKYGRRKAVDLPSLDSEDIETSIRTFNDYTYHYGNDNLIIHEVEQPFSRILFESDDTVILLEGKKDLVATIGDSGKWIIDHKTSSKKPLVSPLVNQFFAYVWAAEFDIRGVIYNAVGTQKTLENKDKFKRIPVTYTEAQLEEWHTNTILRVSELVGYIEKKMFPMNFTVCKGNFSLCQYHKICTSQPDDRARVINTYYKHKPPHDPYSEVDG